MGQQQQVNSVPPPGPISAEAISLSDAPLRAHPRAREPGGDPLLIPRSKVRILHGPSQRPCKSLVPLQRVSRERWALSTFLLLTQTGCFQQLLVATGRARIVPSRPEKSLPDVQANESQGRWPQGARVNPTFPALRPPRYPPPRAYPSRRAEGTAASGRETAPGLRLGACRWGCGLRALLSSQASTHSIAPEFCALMGRLVLP